MIRGELRLHRSADKHAISVLAGLCGRRSFHVAGRVPASQIEPGIVELYGAVVGRGPLQGRRPAPEAPASTTKEGEACDARGGCQGGQFEARGKDEPGDDARWTGDSYSTVGSECSTREGRQRKPPEAAVTTVVNAAVGAPTPPTRPLVCVYKARGDSPYEYSVFSLSPRVVCVTLRFLLRNLLVSQLWTGHPIAMASTRCQPVALSYPDGPISKLHSQSSKPPARSDAMALGSAARQVIDLTIDDDDDDDGDGLPFPSEIPGPSRQVIDLTIDDDDDDGDGDGDEVAEVRGSRNGRAARCHVRLIPTPSPDRLGIVDQLLSTPTVLLAQVSHTRRRRHSGHTWRQEIPLEECTFVVPVARQTATAFRYFSPRPDHGCVVRRTGQPWFYRASTDRLQSSHS